MSRSLPRFELPEMKLPTIDQERLVSTAKDVAYVVVGFGVLTFQRAQVRRQEMAKRFATDLRSLDSRVEGVATRLDEIVGKVAEQLPDPAGNLLEQAQKAAVKARGDLRARLVPAA